MFGLFEPYKNYLILYVTADDYDYGYLVIDEL